MSLSNIGLFDMDGSLADYDGQLLEDLQALQAPEEPPLASLWESEQRFPHIHARMRLIKSQPGWWRRLKPIPKGLQVLEKAKELGFECHILTKGPRSHPAAWQEKVEWCLEHLGEIPVHVTSDKGLVYGKFLYDDYPDYIARWLKNRPRGLVIMPDTEYNRSFAHPQVVRWKDNWAEVVRAMEAALRRNHGEPLKL